MKVKGYKGFKKSLTTLREETRKAEKMRNKMKHSKRGIYMDANQFKISKERMIKNDR